MKQNLISILAFTAIIVGSQSCKKERVDAAPSIPIPEPAITLYKAPDPVNPAPGHYFITFKESFMKPYAAVYTGSKTERGAKEAGAAIYARDAQTAILTDLRNPDGSPVVPMARIKDFVSNVIVGFDAELTSEEVKKLVANPNVKYVELQGEEVTDDEITNTQSTVAIDPAVQYVDPLRQAIGFKNGLNQSLTNTIWIIDGGCDMDHPDLKVYAPWAKSFSDDPSVEDAVGHGTKVAGVLAAIDNSFGTRGVAAGAWIVPIKITNKNESSSPSNFVKALDYVWAKSINDDVINISQSFTVSNPKINVAALEEAIKGYVGYEVWFAISAGNQHTFASTRSPARMCSPNYPWSETLKFLTCVSSYGTGYKFSQIFGTGPEGSNYGVAVDYAAPGEKIYTTAIGGKYTPDLINGTSFATPLVAGILFLNKGVIYHNKTYVNADVDGSPDKCAFLNYKF